MCSPKLPQIHLGFSQISGFPELKFYKASNYNEGTQEARIRRGDQGQRKSGSPPWDLKLLTICGDSDVSTLINLKD